MSALDGSAICEMTFPDGLKLRLRALYCQATYAGHLEGAHTKLTNDRRIRGLANKATTLWARSTPVHVVEPGRTVGRALLDVAGEPLAVDGEPVRREWLPPVCCIGDFEADAVEGADGCASGLIVVWFQPEPPTTPMEPWIVDMFLRIDWDQQAASYWY